VTVLKKVTQQKEFPINLFYTLVLFNALMFMGVALVYCVFGGIAIAMGLEFSQGYDAAKDIVAYAHQLTEHLCSHPD
jgi:Mg2+/citrate symporter